MIKPVKQHIGFPYSLTKIQLYTLIPQEVLNKIKDKSIACNIFRIKDNESIMCEFYYIVFLEYMLSGKTLLDCTNLLSPNDYKKNNKII